MPGSGNSIFRHFDFLQLYLSHSNTQYVKRQVILCSTTLVYHSNIKRCDLWVEILKTSNLGVYVDQHLTWKEHIKNISNKIAKNVGIIARSSYLLPQTIRIKLYYSLIFPYLTYCNVVWAGDHLSADALHYLAGYVAFKLKRQHPDLGQVYSQISSVPVTCRMWLPCLSRGGLRIPSDGWFRAVEQLENDFRAQHGLGLRREKMLLHR